MSNFGLIFSIVFLHLFYFGNTLKCRTGEETQQSEDFEYVVRMCLRQLKNNASHHENGDRTVQSMFDPEKARKDRNGMFHKNRNYRSQEDRGSNDGFEYFWGSNGNGNAGGRDNDRDKYRDQQRGDRGRDRDNGENDYPDNPDYFHTNPMWAVSGDDRARVRPRPHSYQQQIQHDRDMSYGYRRHRDNPYAGYQNSDRSNSAKRTPNREKKGESALEQLDPCMIHCIFQEMHMLDENGRPDKRTVSEKMSQKIRNPELKSFVQDSVDECFDEMEEAAESTWNNRGGNSRNGAQDFTCVWAKNFAICLEEKGKDSCEDWEEPIQRNSSNSKGKEEQKNKTKDGKTANNSNRG